MSKIIKRAYKFRFYPQNDLKIMLAKTFGCSRFVFNKLLEITENNYSTKYLDNNDKELDIVNPLYKPISNTDRINYIVNLKKKFIWLSEVSSIALQQSAKHLNTAYDRFFKGHAGKPSFKKKLNRNSFTITGKGSLHFDEKFNQTKKFYLPKYNKPLNIKFSRNFNHLAVSSVTVSQEPSGKYFISFLVEEEIKSKTPNRGVDSKTSKVSIDLGLKTHAKVYDGKEFYDFNLPELLKSIDKKISREQKSLSRKVKGSNNRNKQRIIVAKLYEKKSNIMNDFYHKLSSKLINDNQEIKMEDLAVKNLIKNRKLSRSIHNVAWSRFTGMLVYKSEWHERKLEKANRYYGSSKTCNCCKHINHSLSLKDRVWECNNCHAVHDRDENACLNLYDYEENSYLNNLNTIKVKKNLNKKNSNNKSSKFVGTTDCGGEVRPESSKLI